MFGFLKGYFETCKWASNSLELSNYLNPFLLIHVRTNFKGCITRVDGSTYRISEMIRHYFGRDGMDVKKKNIAESVTVMVVLNPSLKYMTIVPFHNPP